MSARRGRALATLVAVSLVALACTGRPARLWVRDFEPDQRVELDASRMKRLEGRACGFQLFGLIPIGVTARTHDAYRRMTLGYEKLHVTNITMQQSMTWWGLGTRHCTTLTGEAYPRR